MGKVLKKKMFGKRTGRNKKTRNELTYLTDYEYRLILLRASKSVDPLEYLSNHLACDKVRMKYTLTSADKSGRVDVMRRVSGYHRRIYYDMIGHSPETIRRMLTNYVN